MIERIGHWLAGGWVWMPPETRPDLEERVDAVVERVDGLVDRANALDDRTDNLEQRVDVLEHNEDVRTTPTDRPAQGPR